MLPDIACLIKKTADASWYCSDNFAIVSLIPAFKSAISCDHDEGSFILSSACLCKSLIFISSKLTTFPSSSINTELPSSDISKLSLPVKSLTYLLKSATDIPVSA